MGMREPAAARYTPTVHPAADTAAGWGPGMAGSSPALSFDSLYADPRSLAPCGHPRDRADGLLGERSYEMTPDAGRATVTSTADVSDTANLGGQQNQPSLSALAGSGCPVKDRWMSELIRHTSGRRPGADRAPAPTTTAPSPLTPPSHLTARLRKAVQWGYQEREFESSSPQPASLGQFLTWSRQQCSLSTEDVGRRAGLTPELVEQLEADSVCPTEIAPDTLARLALALDASIWTVLERLAPPASSSVCYEMADSDADMIWSSEPLRCREPFERVSLRNGAELPAHAGRRLAAYRQAVYQAWRQQQRD